MSKKVASFSRGYDRALDKFCETLSATPVPFCVRVWKNNRGLLVCWPADASVENSAVPGQILYSRAACASELFRYVVEAASDVDDSFRGKRAVTLLFNPDLCVVPKSDFSKLCADVKKANAAALAVVGPAIPTRHRAAFLPS